MNALKALQPYGQSVWLDYIRRSLITTGELLRLIAEDGLRGVTSNPAIFEKAITGSTDYADALKALEARHDLDAQGIYEQLAIADVRDAADVMRRVYTETGARDGYVSLEVSPFLARDTPGTIEEARRLWRTIGRPNVMIKVPATPQGIPAIQTLIGEGINVNVTLLFARAAYERVAEAYLSGLETLAGKGGDLRTVASVASFFVSRIDTALDARITTRLKTEAIPSQRALLRNLVGKAAIANARLAYQHYKELYSTPRWLALAVKGARSQRLLWASTSTKNPNYRDVMYVEELIGPDTVNTIPPATFEAFREHGRPRASLEEDIEGAHDVMDTLERVGISMTEATDRLLEEGIRLFVEPFEKLLKAVEQKCRIPAATRINRQTSTLPEPLGRAVEAALQDWQRTGKVHRLWTGDPALWTGSDERQWLGWLGVTEDQLAHIGHLNGIAEDVQGARFSHALLLGMGGSSLCPEVLRTTFGTVPGFPELHVLDSTDPAQIRAVERKVDLGNTLVIVSSKSGSTLEPNMFKQYFFERVTQTVGPHAAGQRFIAITDPGSALQQVAERDGFRHIFFGTPSIGGRYSALSHFGMVPAAIMGVNVPEFLDCTEEMVHACASCVPAADNPGVVLGTILGTLGAQGRNKVTITASPGIRGFGAWAEQLLAESTGKEGKGLIPVDREPLGPPEVYGADRVFVYVRLQAAPDPAEDAAVSALEQAGHPVVRIAVPEREDLGQEFFRWEFATAVAGSILGINPFNQPDVEASKVATRKLTAEYEQRGTLPAEAPILEEAGLRLFTNSQNSATLTAAAGFDRSLVGYLRAHLGRLGAGDYLAILAYLEMNAAHEEALQRLRADVRDAKHVATCLGFGPRFLHSTGQAYKGGPNTGVFLQLTCDDAADLAVPGQRYTFGIVKAAQARGDFEVLAERRRRVLRVHLGPDVPAGLATLGAAVRRAVA